MGATVNASGKSEIEENGPCNGFRIKVERAVGEQLGQLGMRLAHVEGDESSAQCLLIYEDSIKLRFILERGGTEVSIGHSSTPYIWTSAEGGSRRWFQLWLVLRMVDGRPMPSIPEINESARRAIELGFEAQIQEEINELLRLIDSVKSTLSGPEGDQRIQAYLAEHPVEDEAAG